MPIRVTKSATNAPEPTHDSATTSTRGSFATNALCFWCSFATSCAASQRTPSTIQTHGVCCSASPVVLSRLSLFRYLPDSRHCLLPAWRGMAPQPTRGGTGGVRSRCTRSALLWRGESRQAGQGTNCTLFTLGFVHLQQRVLVTQVQSCNSVDFETKLSESLDRSWENSLLKEFEGGKCYAPPPSRAVGYPYSRNSMEDMTCFLCGINISDPAG